MGVGPAIKRVELRMVHPETYEDVVRGHQGLILACGQNVFSDYLDRTSDDAFIEIDNQRYYDTGDLGILDESDSLVITGRITEFSRRVSRYRHELGRYPPNYHRNNNRPL